MVELQSEAYLGVGDYTFMQQKKTGGRLAAVPGDALDLVAAERAQAGDAGGRSGCRRA